MNKYKIIGYAESFLSFLLSDIDLWKKEIVKQIVLFGSVARDEATKDSDVDLFIEVYESKQKDFVEKRAEHALIEFSNSRVAKEWALRDVKNEIKILVGTLDRISDLKRSMISDGIVLYGKYSAKIDTEHYILISFESIQEKNKRYRVDRYLFGRHEADFSTDGAVKPLGGKRLSTRVFILPIKQAPAIIKYFKSEDIKYVLQEVWSDTL